MPNIHMPGFPGMPPLPQQAPTFTVAAPINDVQVAAMIAMAHLKPGDDPVPVLEMAYSALAASLVLWKVGRFDHYVELHRKALSATEGGKDA